MAAGNDPPMGVLENANKLEDEEEWLPEILDTIREFETASLELVAWELSLPESALTSAWDRALGERLIESAGLHPQTGEQMYRLSADPVSQRS
jgi:hypothetical protein